IGHRPARSANGRVFLVGSHIDTVPDAGRYDGPLGVLLGIAAAQALAGRDFPVALDVIAFSEEEGVRFRTPYLGSRAVAGRFDPDLLHLTDADGITLAQALHDSGLDPPPSPAAAHPPTQGAGNVLPGTARLSLDVRHAEDAGRERATAGLLDQARAVAGERGLSFDVDSATDQPAVPMDPALTDRLAAAVESTGVAPYRMP